MKKLTTFKNKKIYNGYTLIELVIVLALLTTVGIFIASTLFLALRATKKAQTISIVKENGNFAVNEFAQTIRNAKIFNGVNDTGPSDTFNQCTQTLTSYNYVQVRDYSGNNVTLSCSGSPKNLNINFSSPNGNPTPPDRSLIDNTKVKVDSCKISCAETSGQPIIRLILQLDAKQGLNGDISENKDTQTYETTVFMRNAQ